MKPIIIKNEKSFELLEVAISLVDLANKIPDEAYL